MTEKQRDDENDDAIRTSAADWLRRFAQGWPNFRNPEEHDEILRLAAALSRQPKPAEGPTPRTVRRFREVSSSFGGGRMLEKETGEWVSYDDYSQLERELAEVTKDRDMWLADSTKQNNALGRVVAERDLLRSAIRVDDEIAATQLLRKVRRDWAGLPAHKFLKEEIDALLDRLPTPSDSGSKP